MTLIVFRQCLKRHRESDGGGRSASERVGREDRVVEDHRLGLAAKKADFQRAPELVGVRARPVVVQSIEPAPSLFAMAKAVVRHREEQPVQGLIGRPFRRLICLL